MRDETKRCSDPTPNLQKKERDAFRDLSNNDILIVLPTDKSNTTVVMNTTDSKLSARDPTPYVEETIETKIESF